MTTLDLLAPEAVQAGHVSQLYALLSQALRYPSAEVHNAASSGQLARDIASAAAGLPFALSVPQGLQAPGFPEMAQAHIELFELGGSAGVPAFIYEGEYGGGRLGVIEDVLRFYDHFGVSPSVAEDTRDRPDHVANELEFMHVLAFQEAAALQQGVDPGPYRRAQRDFLRFHLVEFTEAIAATTVPKGVAPYSGITGLARDLCGQHLQFLNPAHS